jgi:glyoxylase-like metal-dependent hydrolase (beta-lactamase superfamily II)
MEIKSKIIKLQEPIEQLSSAFMKELRLHNRTKRVYEINPYAEVYTFRENIYGFYTDNIDGGGPPWMFLVVGPEKAMLVDTGCGQGNLKGLCDEISGGKPLIVVNTHPHPDHSAGNFQFDKIYCHEYCVPYLKSGMDPHRWDKLFDESGKCIWVEFDRNDLIKYKEYEIIGCKDGFVFNLGGDYDIELILLAGHAPGQAGFLDKKNRVLFCGDDFISMRVSVNKPRPDMPYREYATVNAFRAQLEKLVKRNNEFDTLFPGHFIVDIDGSVVQNMLNVCNEIIKDPKAYDQLYERKGKQCMGKFVPGLGTIEYNEDSFS